MTLESKKDTIANVTQTLIRIRNDHVCSHVFTVTSEIEDELKGNYYEPKPQDLFRITLGAISVQTRCLSLGSRLPSKTRPSQDKREGKFSFDVWDMAVMLIQGPLAASLSSSRNAWLKERWESDG